MVWQAPSDDEKPKKRDEKADRDEKSDREDGASQDDKPSVDPWRGSKMDHEDGPPDLDEALKKLHDNVVEFFGGKGKGAGGPEEAGSGGFGIAFSLLILLGFVLWVLSGIIIVSPMEKAVVLRFGAFKEILDPGPHWIPRIIDSEQKLNVTKIHSYDYRDQMLNKDENIVYVSMSVFYRIKEPDNYLFSVVDPIVSLRQATASALRQVVGHTSLDKVMTTGREEVGEHVQKLLIDIINRYHTGLEVTEVTIQEVKAPAQVQAAFDDAIKAREDEQRFIDKAKAYVASVLPIAEGKAQRVIEEAKADKEQTIFRAKGDVSQFEALLPEYNNAPKVTEERLYLDTFETILSRTTKVLVDVTKGGNNQLLYLPLDKLFQNRTQLSLNEKTTENGSDATSSYSNVSTIKDKSHDKSRMNRDSYQRPTRSY